MENEAPEDSLNCPLIRKCILLGTLTLTCSSAALAASISVFTQAEVFSSNPSGSDQHSDSSDYYDPALQVTPQSFSTSASLAAGSANAAATARLGTIWASGFSAYAHDGSNSTARTLTTVNVQDFVTVTGTDPLGGVTFSLAVTGTNPGLIDCCDPNGWYATFYFIASHNFNNIVNLTWNESSTGNNHVDPSTTIYGLHAGDQLVLTYGAELWTGTDSGSQFSTSILASNTAHYYVDAEPGTSIISETTFDYTSQAPEPSTGVLLGGVLLGAAIIRRRPA